ncbi:MAG: Rieske 2Fe-2S domain-containing protein [Caulobacteraceae bacterium]|nr:Rieske 2Fe-2S domain-containing protein [Caulobacteraceae bacterium]
MQMDEAAQVFLCAAAEAPPNSSTLVQFEGEDYALFNTGEAYFAVTNRCPHEGAPLIGCPVFKGSAVVCIMHGWRIPLAPRADGRAHSDGLKRLTVVERDGRLYAAA